MIRPLPPIPRDTIPETRSIGGLAGWLIARFRRPFNARRPPRRLHLLERLTLGPRQTVALIEADGETFILATSADGSPAIHPIGKHSRPTARTSW